MRATLVSSAVVSMLLAVAFAACGGGGDSSEGPDPASVAPASTPLYVEATILPEGETAANLDALAQRLLGARSLGALIVSELESSASDEGEELDFETDMRPWLGRKGALFVPEFAEGDFGDGAFAIQVTDSSAADDFVEKRARSHGEPPEGRSYHGLDFKVDPGDGEAAGVVGDLLVIAETEAVFKRVVTAAEGESLADQDRFTEALSRVPDASAADLYVDLGGLIRQSGASIDAETRRYLEAVGIETKEATAVASLVPGADRVEIDLSSNVTKDPRASKASKLLETLPARSLAAFASPEFGERFLKGIEEVDESGIPGEVPPNELMKGLKQAGIDVESIASGIGDVGLFVAGSDERHLSGALLLEAEDPKQATNTVSNLGLLLRASGTPGVTAVNGEATGFSIRSKELGSKPVVVVAKGSRIAVGYGANSASAVLDEGGETLGDTPLYGEAASALGGTPISTFVNGPLALRLASAVVAPDEAGFEEAKPYLAKVEYAALGSEVSEGLTTAKLIVGFGR